MSSAQIYDLDYLIKRAEYTPKLTAIEIYNGAVDPSKEKQKSHVLRPLAVDQPIAKHVWEFFRENSFGEFTAVLKPSKEIILFENWSPGTDAKDQREQYRTPMQGMPDLQEIIKTTVQREKENESLRMENKFLKARLAELNTAGNKFNNALAFAIDHFFLKQQPTVKAMQGLHNTSTDMSEPTDDEVVAAMEVIHEAFGADWIVRFAARVQADPNIVSQVKMYIP